MAEWKKVVVSGSSAELNSLTLKGAAGTIVNESTVAATKLTGSFSGSFVGSFTNSDGTSVGSQTLDQTMVLGSTTSVAITSSADGMLSGSGKILSGDVTSIGTVDAATAVLSADFDVKAAGNVTLFDTVGANNLTIGDATSTVKTTLFESATSVKSADFDVLAAGNVTLFDSVGDNDLTIGAATTTVKLVGDLVELGNDTSDVVDIKGSVKNDSTVAATKLTGSFTGSFVGAFTNSDGTSVGSQTLDQTMVLGSTTSVAITSSADGMLSGSGKILSGDVTSIGTVDAATAVLSADFDVKAAGNVTLFDTVGANNLTIGDATSTVKTTLFESATSVKSADFDVLAAGNVTLFDSVGDNDLTIGASDTTVKIPGDLIELGNGVGDVVDIKGNLQVAGTASFNHSQNLSVADKYILLNSGSSGTSDSGGIVVQGPNNGIGALFGFISGSSSTDLTRRWGVVNDFNADTSADFTPAAFMSNVVVGSDDTLPTGTYAKKGNIFIGDSVDEVWIYGS